MELCFSRSFLPESHVFGRKLCGYTRSDTPIRGLYEVNTRSAHIAEPEPLGLGYARAQTAAPPLTAWCLLWSCIRIGSRRLGLAAVWLRAARGPMGRWHALGVVLAVRRVVRCMLGLCRMVGFFSRHHVLSGNILDLSVASNPGTSQHIVPDACRAWCL